MTLNEYVQVACLPDPSQLVYPIRNEIEAYIAGWGRMSDGYYASRLQNTIITIYHNSVCSNVNSNITKNWTVQMCAGNIMGGIDSCYGKNGINL